MTLKGSNFNKCFARHFLSKQSVLGTEPLYSGAHGLVVVGWEKGDTPVDRLLTCHYNAGHISNPLYFSKPTQHCPSPPPQRATRNLAQRILLPKSLRGGECMQNPASNICNPDGPIKGRVFIRLRLVRRRYELWIYYPAN